MIETFLLCFPEFAEDQGCTDRGFISFFLEIAAIELNRRGWSGVMFHEGVLLLAADKFMHFWFDIRQDDFFGPAVKTTYGIEFERLARVCEDRIGVSKSEMCAHGAGR